MVFSEQITMKAARVNAGYSLTEAAALLGISRSTLCRWENGESKVKENKKQNLAEVYRMDPRMIKFEAVKEKKDDK